jgi:hypothetical protein
MKTSHHLLRCDRWVSRTRPALAAALLTIPAIIRGAPGDVDLSFDPPTANAGLRTIVRQPDGKVRFAFFPE